MKKSRISIYLFLVVIFFSCDSDSNSIIFEPFDGICNQEITCNLIDLENFKIGLSVSMVPYDISSIESVSDTNNYIGILNDATNGYDVDFDIPEPPSSPNNFISLYFPHPEWENILGDNFTQDIRSNNLDQSQFIEWDFNITSNTYGPIDFSFEMLDEYCCNCIDYIELSSDDETYTIESSDIHTFSFSTYMPPALPPSEMILSFNLKVSFLSSER